MGGRCLEGVGGSTSNILSVSGGLEVQGGGHKAPGCAPSERRAAPVSTVSTLYALEIGNIPFLCGRHMQGDRTYLPSQRVPAADLPSRRYSRRGACRRAQWQCTRAARRTPPPPPTSQGGKVCHCRVQLCSFGTEIQFTNKHDAILGGWRFERRVKPSGFKRWFKACTGNPYIKITFTDCNLDQLNNLNSVHTESFRGPRLVTCASFRPLGRPAHVYRISVILCVHF